MKLAYLKLQLVGVQTYRPSQTVGEDSYFTSSPSKGQSWVDVYVDEFTKLTTLCSTEFGSVQEAS